jgi:hypothetical protein
VCVYTDMSRSYTSIIDLTGVSTNEKYNKPEIMEKFNVGSSYDDTDEDVEEGPGDDEPVALRFSRASHKTGFY